MAPDQGGGGEKTEKATPKKREDARKKGQVLKSAEVNTAVLTVAMFVALFAAGSFIAGRLVHSLEKHLGGAASMSYDFTPDTVHLTFTQALLELTIILLPLLVVALVMGVVTNVAQFGFLISTESMKPKFSKINPLEGLKRLFSLRTVVELLKAVAKVGLVGIVVYQEYMSHFIEFPNMLELSVGQSVGMIVDMCFGVAIKAAMMLVIIGAADYLYQWYDFEKKLKMSKEEVKQEFKQAEGDPIIRAKRREKQRQMSAMRMMQAVPQADVVITNPTHYAIAVKYDVNLGAAPMVLAKGKDRLALRIREIAKANGVAVVENKPVAQALYLACEPGQEIPTEMFAAVAEILAFVYKQNGGKPKGAPVSQNRQPVRLKGRMPRNTKRRKPPGSPANRA